MNTFIMTYLYGSSFEKTILTEIHLNTKPLQYTSVKRGTDSATTKAIVFANCKDLPKGATLYVPAEYVDLYKKQSLEPSDLGWEAWPTVEFSAGKFQTTKADFLWTNANTVVEAED